MTERCPASIPPPDLDGLDPAWSRLIDVTEPEGGTVTWHVLDNGVEPTAGTLLCVHGNPTWSYLWRSFVGGAPAGWRVVAVDQLEMGFSERTGIVRRLDRRIADLGCLTDAMGLDGPTVAVAHDWGGPVALGWVAAHREQVRGVVLLNTAVTQPDGMDVPPLIRAARWSPMIGRVCVDSTIFVRGAARLSWPPPRQSVRDGYLAPYRHRSRRRAIGAFVEDIPVEADHPTHASLDEVAQSLTGLAGRPALVLWGASDPVFSDRFLDDLCERIPHADVHRFPGAGHLVIEDVDLVAPVNRWLAERFPEPIGADGDKSSATISPRLVESSPLGFRDPIPPRPARLWSALDARRDDDRLALAELGPNGRTVTFRALHDAVESTAAGLAAHGISRGDRVAVLIPPGVELTVVIYACWRIGAVAVLVDGGLGLRSMDRALRSARPVFLIGVRRALAVAKVARWPGRRILADRHRRSPQTRPLGSPNGTGGTPSLSGLASRATALHLPAPPPTDADAAVVFTSGSTGPSKGVVYVHAQLEAQRDAVARTYNISPDDRLVAAFAPFALFGPALGIASAVPHMDVSRPGSLTAERLSAAIDSVEATVVFASPASLANVVDTGAGCGPDRSGFTVRLLLSAGAPVRSSLLGSAADVLGASEARTPYGMSEVLPVADIDLAGLDASAPALRAGFGACVGHPIAGVQIAIDPIGPTGARSGALTAESGVLGEVCIRAAHTRDRYDRLWWTQTESASPRGWHRSGDVGVLDEDGRLWIGGRVQHVISTASGVRTPVGLEVAAESVGQVTAAAVVGIGPVGTQQVVVVVSTATGGRSGRASPALADAVRGAIKDQLDEPPEIAAVLTVPRLPVDRRHNSKIDRARVAAWAERVLAGESVPLDRPIERLQHRVRRWRP